MQALGAMHKINYEISHTATAISESFVVMKLKDDYGRQMHEINATINHNLKKIKIIIRKK